MNAPSAFWPRIPALLSTIDFRKLRKNFLCHQKSQTEFSSPPLCCAPLLGRYADSDGNHGFLQDTNGNFTGFDVPNLTFIYVSGINDARTETGDAFNGSSTQGFIRDSSGNITTFVVAWTNSTTPMAISKSGEVAGYAAETGADQAFTRDASGTFFTFEAPGAGSTGFTPGTIRSL